METHLSTFFIYRTIIVLILIVMEDTHGARCFITRNYVNLVLILIVMEDTHGVQGVLSQGIM